jgi:hypothetical protein
MAVLVAPPAAPMTWAVAMWLDRRPAGAPPVGRPQALPGPLPSARGAALRTVPAALPPWSAELLAALVVALMAVVLATVGPCSRQARSSLMRVTGAE